MRYDDSLGERKWYGSSAVSSTLGRGGLTGSNTISGGATVATIAAVEIRLLNFFSVDIGTFQVIISSTRHHPENLQSIFRNREKITISL